MTYTVDYQVSTGVNDGHADSIIGLKNALAFITSGRLASTGITHGYYAWNVTLPSKALIINAYISFYYYGKDGTIPTLVLGFEDACPATIPTTWAAINGKTLTTNTINYTNPGTGTWHNTASITDIIQELVDSYDYSAGKLMLCKIVGNGPGGSDYGRNYSYDGNSTRAAILHIEYTFSAVSSSPSVTGTLKKSYPSSTIPVRPASLIAGGWSYYGASNAVDAVRDELNSSYIITAGAISNVYDLDTIEDFPAPIVPIGYIKVCVRWEKIQNATNGLYFQMLGNEYLIYNTYTYVPNWTDFSQTFLTNPITGLRWTWSDVNELTLGISKHGTAGSLAVASAYIEVNTDGITCSPIAGNTSVAGRLYVNKQSKGSIPSGTGAVQTASLFQMTRRSPGSITIYPIIAGMGRKTADLSALGDAMSINAYSGIVSVNLRDKRRLSSLQESAPITSNTGLIGRPYTVRRSPGSITSGTGAVQTASLFQMTRRSPGSITGYSNVAGMGRRWYDLSALEDIGVIRISPDIISVNLRDKRRLSAPVTLTSYLDGISPKATKRSPGSISAGPNLSFQLLQMNRRLPGVIPGTSNVNGFVRRIYNAGGAFGAVADVAANSRLRKRFTQTTMPITNASGVTGLESTLMHFEGAFTCIMNVSGQQPHALKRLPGTISQTNAIAGGLHDFFNCNGSTTCIPALETLGRVSRGCVSNISSIAMIDGTEHADKKLIGLIASNSRLFEEIMPVLKPHAGEISSNGRMTGPLKNIYTLNPTFITSNTDLSAIAGTFIPFSKTEAISCVTALAGIAYPMRRLSIGSITIATELSGLPMKYIIGINGYVRVAAGINGRTRSMSKIFGDIVSVPIVFENEMGIKKKIGNSSITSLTDLNSDIGGFVHIRAFSRLVSSLSCPQMYGACILLHGSIGTDLNISSSECDVTQEATGNISTRSITTGYCFIKLEYNGSSTSISNLVGILSKFNLRGFISSCNEYGGNLHNIQCIQTTNSTLCSGMYGGLKLRPLVAGEVVPHGIAEIQRGRNV